jgi:multidrug efflux pump subunit AcrA (membrane-fusion protein)
MLVPVEAVRGEGADAVVFVVADGKVAARPVTLGATTAADREVLSGLTAGERVVVSPPPSLADGDRVTLTDATR